jgi:predicted nucleic acid-binding Zn ribbon protein
VKKPQPIHSILQKTIQSLEIDVPLKSYSVLGAWNEIVGEPVAAHSRPRTIRNRILFIDVAHPTWMQQLQFLKPTLLEKINTFLGESLIQDIRFKLGNVLSKAPVPPKTLSMEDQKLDKATLNRIEGVLQKVGDEELRNSLRELLIQGAKLEHYRRRSK